MSVCGTLTSTVPYRDCAVGVERFFASLRMTVSFLPPPCKGRLMIAQSLGSL